MNDTEHHRKIENHTKIEIEQEHRYNSYMGFTIQKLSIDVP